MQSMCQCMDLRLNVCVIKTVKCLFCWCLQKASRHGEGAAICAGDLPDMGLAADFTVFAQSVQTGSLAVPLLQLCCIAD